MQPGEFTLPGSLRALPWRQSHSIIKRPCSDPLHKSSHSGYLLQSQKRGLCHVRTSMDPKQNSSCRDVVRQNSLATNLPFPGCVPAALLRSGVAALCSHGSTGKYSWILQSKRHPNTKRELKWAQGECYSHSLHSLARVTGVPTSQTIHKIRRDSDMLQHTVINETAIYAIILMQSTLGPISSRKLMTLYSTVQHWAVTLAKRKKKAPNYSVVVLLPDFQGQLGGGRWPELYFRFQNINRITN